MLPISLYWKYAQNQIKSNQLYDYIIEVSYVKYMETMDLKYVQITFNTRELRTTSTISYKIYTITYFKNNDFNITTIGKRAY